MLNVQLAKNQPQAPRTKRFEAVIDSGASRCIFHTDIATYLGIDWAHCPIEVTNGIGGQENTYLSDVQLYIPGGFVVIKAGFKEKLPIAGLLGMSGFFEHFNVTFDAAGHFCQLERIYQA